MLTPKEIIAPELLPQEQVRWMGMSSLNTALRHGLPRIAFLLVFAFAPYFSMDHRKSALQYLFNAAWTSFTLNFLYQACLPILTIGKTAFAVTDCRVLWVRRFFGTQFRSFPAGEINILEYDVKPDGSGSVTFRSMESAGIDASGVEKIGFYGVKNVAGAYQALLNCERTLEDNGLIEPI